MSIVSLEQIKAHLRIEVGDDDELLTAKVSAAQDHLERLLGFKIEETYGGQGQDPVPPALREAVCELVGHWYANREAVGMNELIEAPLSVQDVVREYRNYSWAD